MSKVDAQRAMREARYAAMQAQVQQAPRRPAPTDTTATRATATRATATRATPAHAAPTDELCGHRGSTGKPCTRPAKHPEKSHRYA